MNENLNLVEILKDVQKGTKLWSPAYGDCELSNVDVTCESFPIVCVSVDDRRQWLFKADGSVINNTGVECVLFPSEDNRDWSTFKVPNTHKHFESFQRVLRTLDHEFGYEIWVADLYSHYDDSTREHYLVSGFVKADDEIIPYEGNEDKLGKPVEP